MRAYLEPCQYSSSQTSINIINKAFACIAEIAGIFYVLPAFLYEAVPAVPKIIRATRAKAKIKIAFFPLALVQGMFIVSLCIKICA